MSPEMVALDVTNTLNKHGIYQFVPTIVVDGNSNGGNVGIFESDCASPGLREITNLIRAHVLPQATSQKEIEIILKKEQWKRAALEPEFLGEKILPK